MEGKWREFKFDMVSAYPLDKGTALKVELYSKDHICFNDEGYSDHFIEYEAYTHLKAENEKLIKAHADLREELGAVSDALIALNHYGKKWDNWEKCAEIALTKLKAILGDTNDQE